jgi:hypothetical protein
MMRTNSCYATALAVVLSGTTSVVGCGGPYGEESYIEVGTSQGGVQGGTILTAAEELRSGVVALAVPQTGGVFGICSGSILRTSSFRNETYILTAAHCFDDWNQQPVVAASDFAATRPFGTADSVVIHSDYHNDGDGRNSRDMAVVHLPTSVVIDGPDGRPMRNWYRPVLDYSPKASNPSNSSIRVFGAGCQDDSRPCTSLDNSIRYVFDDEYFGLSDGNIEFDDTDGSSELQGGDSGGPWLTAYGTGQTTSDLLNHGLIIGVHTGQYVIDSYASATFAPSNLTWLEEQAGDSVVTPPVGTWIRSCFAEWCHLRDNERAALAVAMLF